jgi:hypothetical protein
VQREREREREDEEEEEEELRRWVLQNKKQDKSIATEETRQRELCSFLSLSLSSLSERVC